MLSCIAASAVGKSLRPSLATKLSSEILTLSSSTTALKFTNAAFFTSLATPLSHPSATLPIAFSYSCPASLTHPPVILLPVALGLSKHFSAISIVSSHSSVTSVPPP
ncbi:hypothetical protein V8G54_029544 [Vigna mungo]|uniref:Uncharacterized protein n=1 Tax=Vigna mungo TaxID=3915 RepID=A0AAQ3RLX3_VIGMU